MFLDDERVRTAYAHKYSSDCVWISCARPHSHETKKKYFLKVDRTNKRRERASERQNVKKHYTISHHSVRLDFGHSFQFDTTCVVNEQTTRVVDVVFCGVELYIRIQYARLV